MLVLTRKMRQQIQVGENITITILKVKGSAVRVGIEAPGEVRVVRMELTEKFREPKADEVSAVASTEMDETPRTGMLPAKSARPRRSLPGRELGATLSHANRVDQSARTIRLPAPLPGRGLIAACRAAK